MSSFASYNSVQRRGCLAVANLAILEDGKKALATGGAGEKIKAALSAFGSDSEIKVHGNKALQISASPATKTTARKQPKRCIAPQCPVQGEPPEYSATKSDMLGAIKEIPSNNQMPEHVDPSIRRTLEPFVGGD